MSNFTLIIVAIDGSIPSTPTISGVDVTVSNYYEVNSERSDDSNNPDQITFEQDGKTNQDGEITIRYGDIETMGLWAIIILQKKGYRTYLNHFKLSFDYLGVMLIRIALIPNTMKKNIVAVLSWNKTPISKR